MTWKATLQLAAVFAALLVSAPLTAADLRDVAVEKEKSRYKLRSETYFDADRESLYRVLTDYDQFGKISSTFVEARNMEPDDQGRPRFYTRMEGCVLLFCKSYIRSGHLVLTPMSDIVAIVDPELSNFKFARERWHKCTKFLDTVTPLIISSVDFRYSDPVVFMIWNGVIIC